MSCPRPSLSSLNTPRVLLLTAAALALLTGPPSIAPARAQSMSEPPQLDAPTVHENGLYALSVSWSAPAADPPVSGYDLQYRKSADTGWIDGPQDQTGSSAEIENLSGDTNYQVRVRAQNSVGAGDWSDPGEGTTALWVSTLTVGAYDSTPLDYWGYQRYRDRHGVGINDLGELSPHFFTYNEVDYHILLLAWFRGLRRDHGAEHTTAMDFYIHDNPIPTGWVLRVHTTRYLTDEGVRSTLDGFRYLDSAVFEDEEKIYWPHTDISLGLNQDYEVVISREPSAQKDADFDPAAALTAVFDRLPAMHNGSTPFTFRLTFSEHLGISALENEVFELTGGTVESTKSLNFPKDTEWEIKVRPSGKGPVTIGLPAGRTCGTTGAVCTAMGKQLSAAVEATMDGPPPEATIAALTSSVTEGTTASYRVRLDTAATEALTVGLRVQETGNMLAGSAPASVDFAVGEDSKTVSLATENDAVWEPHSRVTVRLQAGSGYTLGSAAAAAVTVQDDDPPPILARLEVTAERISEAGGTTTLTAYLSNPSSEVTVVGLTLQAGTEAVSLGTTALTIPTGQTSGMVLLTGVDTPGYTSHRTVTLQGRVTSPISTVRREVRLTVLDDDPPEVAGTAPGNGTVSIPEGRREVDTYTAPAPSGVQFAWAVSGPDASVFSIDASGRLRFRAAPDYETQQGAYAVTVEATDRSLPDIPLTGSLAVTVTVEDAPGRVRLSSHQPQIGRALTATLRDDPDQVGTVTAWRWERSLSSEFPVGELTAIAQTSTDSETATYTPVTDDIAHYLRATVSYTDGHGTSKEAMRDSAGVVTDQPPPPPPPPVTGGGGGGGSGGGGGESSAATPAPVGYLENPGPHAFQSGIGVIAGWVCAAEAVEIELGHLGRQRAAYGTERLDTAAVCGDTDNGFSLLFNWNLLGDGEHEVVAFVDGVELGRATVTVTTLGGEFVRDVTGECTVDDFPDRGATVTLGWQQTSQNFVIVDGARSQGVNRPGRPGVGVLENPGPHAFQSGIGVIAGWVCAADEVEVAIGHLGRQRAAYGTERLDTAAVCGDTDNGFGLLFNWNLLGDGEHAVVAFVDGEELGRATVRVTTLGEEFVRGVEGECVVADFPGLGQSVLLEWQQNSQNFVITGVE